MKKLLLLFVAVISTMIASAQSAWLGTYTVKSQYVDVLDGDKVVDHTFSMTVAKDGNDILVSQFCGFDEILYGGFLTQGDDENLKIICDNIAMTSTDAEREQGIYKYTALRDAEGGRAPINLSRTADGGLTLDDFVLVTYQRGSSEETIARRYTILRVTAGEDTGGDDPVVTAWEYLHPLELCYSFHIDPMTGNFLVSDFRDDLKGGIYVSTDKGANWTKTKLNDNNYNKFYDTDAYIFALGYGGRIARSDDGGLTWELLNYRRTVIDVVGEDNIEYDAAYDMLQMGNRLYVVDYAGGVIYSEDYGETWTKTADDIFIETTVGKDGTTEAFHNVLYGLTEQNGHILAMGLYYVYEYDADHDSWSIVRYDSNLMAIHCKHKGQLYCGRSMPNDDALSNFLEVTADGVNWTATGRPETVDNNVRALGSNNQILVAGLQSTGIYYSTDDGQTWKAMDLDGLPLRYPGQTARADQKLTPLSIEFDDQYVYVAFFGSDSKTEAGIWRYPIASLDLTGVAAVTLDRQATAIFDLSGRRIAAPRNGLYIKNGQKFVK